MSEPVLTLTNASVECEVLLPTRVLFTLLWKRVLGWNPNLKLRLSPATVIIMDADAVIEENN